MVGILFVVIIVGFIGYKAYGILKKDRKLVDNQFKGRGGGGSSAPFESDDLVEGEPQEFKEAK